MPPRPARRSCRSPSPAATTCSTPAPRWPAIELAGLDVDAAAAALADFPGVRRRLELKGERDGARIYDDYAHHPTEVRAALAALRGARPRAADRRLPAPPLLAHQGARRGVRRGAGAGRRGRGARRLPGARGAGRRAGRGQRPAGRPRRRRADGGQAGLVAARPRSRRGEALAPRARARARSWSRSAPATSSSWPRRWSRTGRQRMSAPPPEGVERDYPAGAPDHRAHRRPRRLVRPARDGGGAAGRCSPGPGRRGVAVGVVGSGSNLLVADDGFRGLAIKLDGELAAIERDGERVALRRRRPAALGRGEGGGLGALRPRVRDQHPRHRRRRGEDERQRLRRPARRGARVGRRLHRRPAASAAPPEQLGFAYRSSNLGPDEVVARASFRLHAGRPRRRSRRRWRRCARGAARPSPRGSRPSARPSRTPRTSGPRAAPPGSCSRRPAAAACAIGGARFSEKHANFVENTGDATTADVLELMAEGRRRVHERFGVVLEPEVQLLGEVELARAAGSCEAPRLLAALVVVVAALAARLLARCCAATTVEPRLPSRSADLGDRLGIGRGRGFRRAADPRLAAGPRGRDRCRGCPLAEPPQSGRLAGPMLQQARVLGAAPPSCVPISRAASTAKAGWTWCCARGSNCASATPRGRRRSGEPAAAVLADPSITSARLRRPARAAAGPASERLWAHALRPLA